MLHLAALVILADELGVDPDGLKHIPFKGGGKAAAAVSGGHVDLIVSEPVRGHQQHRRRAPGTGRGDDQRSGWRALPDVPTVSELGYPGLETVIGWSGIWGPKDLPPEVVEKWVAVLQELSKDPEWNKMTVDLGSVPSVMGPADTEAFVKAQYEKFNEVTERLGLTIK